MESIKSNSTLNLGFWINILALFAGIYHMIMARWLFIPLDQHKIIHVGLGLCVVFLSSIKLLKGKQLLKRSFLILLTALSAGLSFYLFTEYEAMATRIGFPIFADTIVGFLLVVLVLEATRRTWGFIIPLVVIFAMLYGYFGRYLPGILYHGGLKLPRLLAYASTYFSGIYGSLTGTGSMEVFMFCMLGSFLSASGAIEFFIDCARSVGRRSRSGPGQAAIVSSGLMGIVSGSVAANVVTTGYVTIPLMIDNGYKPEFAGAVSAVASTGGQLMPPVMGVAAFLISASTGTPYFTLCKMAFLPAVAYYVYLFAAVHFRALKINLPKPKMANVNLWSVFKQKGYLLLPIVLLMWLMAKHVSPSVAAFYSIFALIGLYAARTLIFSQFNLKIFFKNMVIFMYKGLSSGALEGLKIGLILACLGIMVEIVVVTGFAQKLSFQMVELSGGNLPLLLILVAITCIVFGVGMPTTGVYMVVSVLAAPALIKFGIPTVAAHLYVFYFGLMAMVTPPVAVGAIVASGIAKSDYLKTGLAASKLAIPGFLLPFFFIYRPQILFINGTAFDAVIVFLSCSLALFCLAAVLEKHMFYRLRIIEMLLLIAASSLLIHPSNITTICGALIACGVILIQLKRKTSVANS